MSAALAIWVDISETDDKAFNDWHAHEHLAERVRLPGWRRGSRLRGIDLPTRYLLLYDADTLSAFDREAYYARLRDPTPLSRAVLPRFRNTSRTACSIERRIGSGIGPVALIFREPYENTFDIVADHGPLRLDFLRGHPAVGQAHTEERRLRGAPDSQIGSAIIGFFAELDAARAASKANASYFAEVRYPPPPHALKGELFRLLHSVSADDS